MIAERVADAVRRGRFHVWAAERIDQAIEQVTGLEAGRRDARGQFPPISFNARVRAGLLRRADRARAAADGSR